MKLKGVCIGAGYFSHFHYDAWHRMPEVEITAFSDLNAEVCDQIKSKYEIKNFYEDYREMLVKEKPDFVDIITPPGTHAEICRFAAELGVNIICQKPLVPTFKEAYELYCDVSCHDVRFIVHDNFRFQPWHREIKSILNTGVIGELHSLLFRSRMGDGWGEDAYLGRQPYFREYDKLLIYETGVHFIDIFRYHAGEPDGVFTLLRKLNPIIKGEDAALLTLTFENGTVAQWDANRYNDHNYAKDRYTFGDYLVEGSKGSIRLYDDGKITTQLLGEREVEHNYFHEERGFAGDSCLLFQKHAINAIANNEPCETEVSEYLKTLQVQELAYASSQQKKMLHVERLKQPDIKALTK